MDNILTVEKIIEESPETKTLRFKLGEFEFKPGQFVLVNFLTSDFDVTTKIWKAFSISSSPNKDYIDITIKREGFFSTRLTQHTKVGDKLRVKGPFGNFTFDNEENKKLFLIAGGTGLAPFMSMLRFIEEEKLNTKVTLLYSVRTPQDVLFKTEVEKMKKNKNFKFVFTATRLDIGEKWQYIQGRINESLIIENIEGKYEDILFYTCGPKKMLFDILSLLEKIGIPKRNLKYEQWN